MCLVARTEGRGEWCGDKSRPSLGIPGREKKKQRGKLSSALARNANVSDRNIESSTSQFS